MMALQRGALTWALVLALGCSPGPSGPSVAPKAVADVAVATPRSVPSADELSESQGSDSRRSAEPFTATAPEGSNAEPEPEPERPSAGADRPHAATRKPDNKRIANAIDEALKLASKCPVDRELRGRTFPVTITISNDGKLHASVKDINISRPDDTFEELWVGPRGTCIPEQFASVTVPPFDGDSVVVARKLRMP